jgi:NitT/TauT family transport system ATP-binding protein
MKVARIGFMPLTDAALVIVAAEGDFGGREGVSITPVRDVSWANVRDKLNIGLFDAAHMLAPLAIAATLGIGQARAPMVAPVALGLNGNAITVSSALAREMGLTGEPVDPLLAARAVRAVVVERAAAGLAPLTFAMTFPFSMHNYQLRHWLSAGGVDPDADVRLVVIPPPYMVEHMRSGLIDGFCVGSPWNAVAVDSGVGVIAATGSALMTRAPEKVLAITAGRHAADPDLTLALVRAIAAAADHLAEPGRLAEAAHILAQPRYLDLPAEVILRTLDGQLRAAPAAPIRAEPGFLKLSGANVNRPDHAHAAFLYAQMVRFGQTAFSETDAETSRLVYRADLYDTALGLAAAATDESDDTVGMRVGTVFRADDIAGYLRAMTTVG